jgi:hypothetical protein
VGTAQSDCQLRKRAFVLRDDLHQATFGPEDPNGPAMLAGIVRTALPLIERTGAATAIDVGAETRQLRLGNELAAAAAGSLTPR